MAASIALANRIPLTEILPCHILLPGLRNAHAIAASYTERETCGKFCYDTSMSNAGKKMTYRRWQRRHDVKLVNGPDID